MNTVLFHKNPKPYILAEFLFLPPWCAAARSRDAALLMWMRNTFLHCWISFSSDQIFKIKSERVCSLSKLNFWNRDCAAQTMADQERSHPWWPRWLPGTPAILRQQSWGEWNNFIMEGVFLGLYTDIIIRFSHNGDNDRYYCWRVGGGVGGGGGIVRNWDFPL